MHTTDYFKDLDFLGLKKLTNQPSRILIFIKKHSLNNALPIAAVSTWFQFSLGYVAAIIITSNDLSFITAIFNPTLMSAYALVSVILGAVLLTSLALKYMNREKIKESLIDEKIRGGKPKEISEINKKVEKLEMIIKLGSEKKFSIILPISKTQDDILEGQIEENKNKIILLTIPYVISAAVILGALIQNRFSFANVIGWQEWVYIALVSTITVVGICIAFYKLRNNEKNETHDFVKKFDNWDILFPWKKVGVASVMQERATGQEGNGPFTPIIRALKEIGDKLCEIAEKGVQGVEKNFNSNINIFLKEIKEHIKTLLDNNVGAIKTTANEEITDCLRDISVSVDALCEEVGEDVKDKLSEIDVKKLMKLVSKLNKLARAAEDRVARLELQINKWGITQATFGDKRISNLSIDNESDDNQTPQDENEFTDVLGACNKRVDKLQKQLEEIKGKQEQPSYASDKNERRQLRKKVLRSEGAFDKLKKECEEVQKKQSLPNSQIEEIITLNIKIQEIEERLKEVQNKQNQYQYQSDNSNQSPGSKDGDNITDPPETPVNEQGGNTTDSLEALETKVEKQREEVRKKRLKKESSELAEEDKRLSEELEELPKQKKWRETLNGLPSELFGSLLEEIKLEIVHPGKTKIKTTLREIGATMRVHFRNAEQKICPIKGKGSYQIPDGAVINFLDTKFQAARERARG